MTIAGTIAWGFALQRIAERRQIRMRICLACEGRLVRQGELLVCRACGAAWPRRRRKDRRPKDHRS
jgi:hypothetical protein